MLVNIIANYLQISPVQAKSLLDLFTLEKLWLEQPHWKGNTYQLSAVKTQADLMSFIQAAAQSKWYKNYDDSKLADTHFSQEVNQRYFSLFEGLGLINAVSCNTPPIFSAVLGCFEDDVIARVDTLKQDILNNNLAPKARIIFGLGCDRELGTSFVEQASINKLKKAGQATTEMNMINLLIYAALEDLVKQDDKFKSLVYQPVTTTPILKTNSVNTADTAISLKQVIENQYDIPKPINIIVYSNQPYVLRQQRDIQQTLGADFNVVGVGSALTQAEFNKDPKSINICLGEVARLININYTPENLKRFADNLTADEIEEVNLLS